MPFVVPPVGEEALSLSHAGGEFEAYTELYEALNAKNSQMLDMYFKFDKYALLSTSIYHNYVQAFNIISINTEFLCHSQLTSDNFEADLADKHQYLQQLSSKKNEDSAEMEYVKALNELDEAEYGNLVAGSII
ncbi:hypothetical protein SERLA73DRAFT_157412 [Serpula lacrymans var. lacrymans S7.3]|uniref:Uncharacterized protein n=1 Tax=Serpula lacrymans var. lacrymans (strain S7.3) TaxID=936435 RepID=F8QIW5_SERL3|nr:hypothetical protein SERLA73DRAFT_157412 [Serpula lacrymans var. lacrymans S7.3]